MSWYCWNTCFITTLFWYMWLYIRLIFYRLPLPIHAYILFKLKPNQNSWIMQTAFSNINIICICVRQQAFTCTNVYQYSWRHMASSDYNVWVIESVHSLLQILWPHLIMDVITFPCREWPVVWPYQAITLTNVGYSWVRSCNIELGSVLLEILNE